MANFGDDIGPDDWETSLDGAAEIADRVSQLEAVTSELQIAADAPVGQFSNLGVQVLELPRPAAGVQIATAQRGGVLYFDLETAPDYERLHLFNMEPLPEPRPMTAAADCPDAAGLLKKTLDDLEKTLLDLNPVDEWLAGLVELEGKAAKPRAGVAKAAKAVQSARAGTLEAEGARRKLLSVTPEYCRIVALGWAVDDGEPRSLLAVDQNDERALLQYFWDTFRNVEQVCGFNVLAFDLAVVAVRSILLGVEPTRAMNLAPFGNRQVCDLMVQRFGKGRAMGLKPLARAYGIPVPAGDTTGADVERLLAEDPALVCQYVESDVQITRALRGKWLGLFV